MNNKPKVLLIDDEPDILHVVKLLLQTEGFQVEVAGSGEEALKLLNENSFDITVSDYLMPNMNGIELLKQVRASKDYTPFIFFSGNADETHSLKMTGLGAYQLLCKTNVMELADVINKTLKIDAKLTQINLSQNDEQDEFLVLLHSA